MKLTLGVDIGGSHVAAALVHTADGKWLAESYATKKIDPASSADRILDEWAEVIGRSLAYCDGHALSGIGIAMPGPFDYDRGVSMIEGVEKYERLFGVNVRQALVDRLGEVSIWFENDAACFGLGECLAGKGAPYKRVIAITLGTGFGACFVDAQRLVKSGPGVPPGGCLYNIPYREGIAEDYFSSRGLLAWNGDVDEKTRFREWGLQLGQFLAPWIRDFQADVVVIGGGISQSAGLFVPAMQEVLDVRIEIAEETERTAIVGAASVVKGVSKEAGPRRKTEQALMPKRVAAFAKASAAEGDGELGRDGEPAAEGYNIYPFTSLGDGRIFSGYRSLAEWISREKTVLIDGYVGVDWDELRTLLAREFREMDVRVMWYEMSAFLRPADVIEAMVAPFLGTVGSVWGRRTTLVLEDFYRAMPEPVDYEGVTIVLGIGAALCEWDVPVLYIELPKNEIQFRMRAGSAGNLGDGLGGERNLGSEKFEVSPAEMYKRYYFVDWVVLNKHRQAIKSRIAAVGDGQWGDDIHWTLTASVWKGLDQMAHNLIRARPWFEPGVWGGQWMKAHIPALNQQAINYAWSFELIAPENGLVLESSGYLLEISWDWLMEQDAAAVLGKDAERFGLEFPIRFDFLDTYNGGNLSIQCHPSLEYARDYFGETITQDETYYILDCTADAGVYLGFCDHIDPAAYRAELEYSQAAGEAIDIQQYVMRLPSEKHALYLIPNCTVHGAGRNNLVLEISATPYIFTFKMYDWMRLDLNNALRPINIEHAFNNLDFSRQGQRVRDELVSKPVVLCGGGDVQTELLPTHPEHFYAIHRVSFLHSATITTENQCHLLMLVEGVAITVRTKRGMEYRIHYAETFVLPAAAEEYELINLHDKPVKLIKAFVK